MTSDLSCGVSRTPFQQLQHLLQEQEGQLLHYLLSIFIFKGAVCKNVAKMVTALKFKILPQVMSAPPPLQIRGCWTAARWRLICLPTGGCRGRATSPHP